jgi:hypothetical protein
MRLCDVCGKETDTGGIACSSLGPISLYYCQECLQSGREPWGILVSTISSTNQEDYRPEFIEYVETLLEYYNKTWEDLVQEAKAFWKEYEEYLKQEAFLDHYLPEDEEVFLLEEEYER